MAIKPGTTVEQLAPWANQIDMALVMTVEPGFGGQKFMEDMMPKVNKLKDKNGSRDWHTTFKALVIFTLKAVETKVEHLLLRSCAYIFFHFSWTFYYGFKPH